MTQPWNPFGTSPASQLFVFGAGAQNTLNNRPLGNPPTATTPANFTPTANTGTSIFGTNQAAPVAQPTNIFGLNLTGTTTKFSPVASQGPISTASTTSNITHSNNNMTTIASPFGSNIFGGASPSGSIFNQPVSTASTTPLNPWSSTTSTGFNPSGGILNQPISTASSTSSNPWGSTTSTGFSSSGSLFNPPVSTASSTLPNPFATNASTVTKTSIFGTPISTMNDPFKLTAPATSSIFPPQSIASTNIFTQATTAQPPVSTASTNPINWFNNPIPSTSTTTVAPVFPVNPIVSTASTSNIFSASAASTATTVLPTNNFMIQPAVSTPVSFSFLSSTTSILNTTPPSTTIAPNSNFPWMTGLVAAQIQPAVTSSSLTIPSQTSTQEQNTHQSVSIIQQQFLAASLLDPYANRGRKDFTSNDQMQALTESAAVSTLSTTTNTTTITTSMTRTTSTSIMTSTSVTTSAPIPITNPIQSNLRKVSSSRSSVDVNFKLKPVSSSPTLNDDIKPWNQRTLVSTGPVKSTLAGNFTDEEELVLLGRTKLSKLRLSSDIVDTSYQSESIRSLYPVRRLAELEKFTNITPPSSLSSSPTSTVINERISRSSNENRDSSPSHRSISSASPQRSSSPIIQRKSNNYSETYRLPILTRDNYYMKPTLSELKTLFNDKGQCILKQFTVGHEQYGSVTFYGQFDVAGLNLDEIIEINRHEVIVYPDDKNKPSVGEELNRPARITLLGIYPIDRATRKEITDIERIKATNYTDYLREVTKKFDGEFINYGITDGSWTFMVKHFTRYGLDDNQDDFVAKC